MHAERWLASLLVGGVVLIDPSPVIGRDRLPSGGPPRHESHEAGYVNWCGLHVTRREYRLAMEDCDEALADNPVDADSYSNRGVAYLMLDEPERAISDLQAALQLTPANSVAHYNLAAAYLKMRDYARAVSSYDEVIRLEPGHAPAYNNRGHALEQLGERERAIMDYRRARELAPEFARIITRNLKRLGAE